MSIFKHVQWQDGTEISFGDLSNISKFLRSQVFDTMSMDARLLAEDAVPDMATLFALGNGGGPRAQGLGVTNGAGVIFQSLGASVTGDDANLTAYYVAAAELLTTADPADPALPRVDLVCVKLDLIDDVTAPRDFQDAVSGAYSSLSATPVRKVRLTKQYVKGTVGAHTDPAGSTTGGTPNGSPALPAVPSGYVPWAAVYIPAAATILGTHNVWDFRVPLGARLYEQAGSDAWIPAGAAGSWTRQDPAGFGIAGQITNPPGSVSDAYFMCPATSGRVLRVGLQFASTGGPANMTAVLRMHDFSSGSLGSVPQWQLLDLSSVLGIDNTPWGGGQVSLVLHASRGAPLWGGGYPSTFARGPNVDPRTRLHLKVTASGACIQSIYSVKWIIAG